MHPKSILENLLEISLGAGNRAPEVGVLPAYVIQHVDHVAWLRLDAVACPVLGLSTATRRFERVRVAQEPPCARATVPSGDARVLAGLDAALWRFPVASTLTPWFVCLDALYRSVPTRADLEAETRVAQATSES